MDKSDKTLGRRDFIRVVGGTLVATELSLIGCSDAESPATAVAPTEGSAAGSGAPAAPPESPAASPATTTPAAPASSGPAPAAGGPQPTEPPGMAPSGSAGSESPPSVTPPMTAAGGPAVPTPTAPNGPGKVFVIKASSRAEGIEQALAMFGGLGFVAGRDVVLKPNFNSQYEFPATTHDDTLRTVVSALKAADAGQITLGESSGATTGSSTPTATVVRVKGTNALCDELGIEFLSYDTQGVEFETFDFDGMTWSGGLAIPKLMRSDRVKVLLPCCKTHVLADYTFSIKLAAGLPPRSRRGLISDMHTNLHEKVTDINKGFDPDLIVMDAMQCFIDGGPDSGTTRSPGLIVVSNDRIALDAVGVAILKNAGSTSAPIRGKIFDTRQLVRAVEIGLSETKSPDDIELIGNDDATLMQLRSILDVG